MSDAMFTFRLEKELKAAFADVASAQDRTTAQLLRVLMRREVKRRRELSAHDAWFEREVEQALREADDASVTRLSHDAVRSSWHERRSGLEVRDSEV